MSRAAGEAGYAGERRRGARAPDVQDAKALLGELDEARRHSTVS
jgi:hypothetical protein